MRACPACDGTIRNPIRRAWFHALFLLELANPPSEEA